MCGIHICSVPSELTCSSDCLSLSVRTLNKHQSLSEFFRNVSAKSVLVSKFVSIKRGGGVQYFSDLVYWDCPPCRLQFHYLTTPPIILTPVHDSQIDIDIKIINWSLERLCPGTS